MQQKFDKKFKSFLLGKTVEDTLAEHLEFLSEDLSRLHPITPSNNIIIENLQTGLETARRLARAQEDKIRNLENEKTDGE